MLAVPRVFLEQLQLQVGASVGIEVDDGRLVVTPDLRRRYTLEELLAKCDGQAAVSQEDQEWLEAPAVGNELL